MRRRPRRDSAAEGGASLRRHQQAQVDRFHRLYYDTADDGGTWRATEFLGVPTYKNPLDLWIVQEILAERRPDVVVELGTAYGGSALFMATMMDAMGKGHVISVDIARLPRPEHPRVTYLEGSSTDPEIVNAVFDLAETAGVVIVAIDSDHAAAHVSAELEAYSPLVSPGSYLIVEDTNVNGNPVYEDHGPGPNEALERFLRHHPEFEVDRTREKFLMTFNPGGFLRRRSGDDGLSGG